MYPDHPPIPSCAGNLARPPCPENSSLRSRYARHNATGFVEHLARPDHAREGHILASVGNHLFLGRLLRLAALIKKVSGRDAHNLRTAPRHEMPYRPRRDGPWAARHDTTLPPPPAGPQSQSPSTAASRSAASPLVSPTRAARPSLRSSAVCFSVAGCWRQGASASTSRATPRCRA